MTRTDRMRAALRRGAVLLVPLALAGCLAFDPYGEQPGWRPDGVNAANLGAMVADRADLVRGRGAGPAGGRLPADAVIRLWQDHAAPLPAQQDISGVAQTTGGK